jgi:hypothetical protein
MVGVNIEGKRGLGEMTRGGFLEEVTPFQGNLGIKD